MADSGGAFTVKEMLVNIEHRLNGRLDLIDSKVEKVSERVGKLERSTEASREVDMYRRWLIGAIFTLIGLALVVAGMVVAP